MKIYISIKSALAVISFAGMAMVSSQVFAGYPSVTFSPDTLNAIAGSNYSQTLVPNDFTTGNYTFTVSGNTDGLTISNPGNGFNLLVSGTPTSPGAFSFNIAGLDGSLISIGVWNGIQSTGQDFTLNVSNPSGAAPEMNASFIPQVSLMLACSFFLWGRKKENTEVMLAV